MIPFLGSAGTIPGGFVVWIVWILCVTDGVKTGGGHRLNISMVSPVAMDTTQTSADFVNTSHVHRENDLEGDFADLEGDLEDDLVLVASFMGSNVVKVQWRPGGATSNLTTRLLVRLGQGQGQEECQTNVNMSTTVGLHEKHCTFWDVPEYSTEVTACAIVMATANANGAWYHVTASREVEMPPLVTTGPDSLLTTGETAHIHVPYEGTLKMPCVVSGSPTPRIHWYKDGQLVAVNATPKPGIYSLGDLSSMEGVYHCEATNQHGVARSGDLKILKPFLGDTDLGYSDEIRQVTEGTDLTLRCHVLESRPAAMIDWNKYWDPVKLDDRVVQTEDGELIFTSTELSDSGQYTCHLYNNYLGEGKDTTVYQVDILPGPEYSQNRKPKRLHPTKAREELYPLVGSDLIIHCIFSGSEQILWQHNGSPFPRKRRKRYQLESANQTLTIKSVSGKDRGEFKCESKNEFGVEIGTIFKVSPQASPLWISPPQSVDASEGESVTLTCEAKGIPQPDFLWYINGKSIIDNAVDGDQAVIQPVPDGSRLTLGALARNRSCSVQCEARNDHGAIWADAYINVFDKPQITRSPEDIELTEDTSDFLFCFHCEGSGDPNRPLSLTWTLNSVPIRDDVTVYVTDDKTLIVNVTEDTVKGYLGVYACVLDDGLSQVVAEASLFQADPVWVDDPLSGVKRLTTYGQMPSEVKTAVSFLEDNWWIFLIVGIGTLATVVLLATLISVRCRGKGTVLPERQASPALMHLLPDEDSENIDTLPSVAKLASELKKKVKEVYIPHNRLKLGTLIGKGEFGRVHVAMLRKEDEDRTRTVSEKVAVKTLKYKPDETEMVERFLREAVTMKGFEHEHILGLIGITFDIDSSPMVILPYMANGDLRKYVQNPNLDITVLELLSMGLQVARGMVYLSSNRTIHRDLAARNCMVDDEGKVKVADFGLSRELLNTNYYQVDHFDGNPLPLRWMAPESLELGVFTTQSDVWSYGVLLWELMTRGEIPYDQVDNPDVADHIRKGGSLTQPPFCPDSVYVIMGQCWERESGRRPSFSSLVTSIEQIVMRARSGSMSTTQTFYVNIGVIARNRRQKMTSLSSWSEVDPDGEPGTSVSSV